MESMEERCAKLGIKIIALIQICFNIKNIITHKFHFTDF